MVFRRNEQREREETRADTSPPVTLPPRISETLKLMKALQIKDKTELVPAVGLEPTRRFTVPEF